MDQIHILYSQCGVNRLIATENHKEIAATEIQLRICTSSFTFVAHNLSCRDLPPSNYVFMVNLLMIYLFIVSSKP